MSRWLDRLSEFLAHRKGLLPLVGAGFIVLNLILQFILPPGAILLTSNLFLHVGLLVAILGLMLAWAL
jgi:hypothetical protein